MQNHFYILYLLSLIHSFNNIMRLYTIYVMVFVAVTVQAVQKSEKGKRRAQNYGSTASTYTGAPSAAAYSSATAAPVYATSAAPASAYATRVSPKANYVSQPVSYEQQQITVQQPVKLAYAQPVQSQKFASVYSVPQQQQQQFSYSFEAQPELRLALAQAQAQAVKYTMAQPQGGKYLTQPEVRYIAQPQQEVRYTYSQPQPSIASQVPAAALAPSSKVSYPTQAIYSHQPQVQQVRPHYSPASSVSSFSFSSPHVSYNNHGVLSQVLHSSPQAPQQQQHQEQLVMYVPAPATAQYTSAQRPAHAQYTSAQTPAHAQPVQYVTAQAQHSTPQVVYFQSYAQTQPNSQAQKPGITYA